MPIDKNGKEIDWFHGWEGVQRLAKAYGLDWADVGFMIEDQHAQNFQFITYNYALMYIDH